MEQPSGPPAWPPGSSAPWERGGLPGCFWPTQKCRRACWAVAGAGSRDPSGPVLALQVRAFLQHPLKGVVLETFGSGNGPTKPDLLWELRAAAERGLNILNCTHCLQGTVTSDYAAGMVGAGVRGLGGRGLAEGAGPAGLGGPASP